MKIILDNIVFYLQRSGGISVCWNEHLNRALRDTELRTGIIEYDSEIKNIHRTLALQEIENKVVKRVKNNPKFYRFFDEKYSQGEKFIFHSSDYRICKSNHAVNIITIHDLMYFSKKWRGLDVWIARYFHKRRLINSVNGANEIICISHSTKSDLLKYIKISEKKNISVIHNGISSDFSLLKSDPENPKFSKYSYVLYVGGRGPYKNFQFVLETIKMFNKKLVIVGQPLSNSEHELINKYVSNDGFSVVANPSNDELNVLYNLAFCLFYPSEFEGFGMPVIEAQKAGCPVIAYARTSIPEILGSNYRLLLHNLCVAEVKRCLELLNSEEERELIINEGLENSKRFTWESNYSKVKQLYSKYT